MTLCEIEKKPEDFGKLLTESSRTIKYHFGPFFFTLKRIGTTLKFKVGDKFVKKFSMIERHFFKNKLIMTVEFECPPCIPKTKNEVEVIYELPDFTP